MTKGSAIMLRSKRDAEIWNEAVVVEVSRTYAERVRLRQYRDGKTFSKAVSTGRLQLYVCKSDDESQKELLRFEYVDILSSRIRALEESQIMTEDDSIV